MNHQETHQTNPMAHWDPLDVSFNPLGPPGPPHRPPGTPKEISWPHWPLKITSTALLIIWGPIKFHFPVDPMGYLHPSPWDLVALTPWHLENLRPDQTLKPWSSGQLSDLSGHLGLVFKCWSYINKLGPYTINQLVLNTKVFPHPKSIYAKSRG